ncbi:MAG: hypothetical protein ACKOBM_09380 [Gammaproteobacteria bacterium]
MLWKKSTYEMWFRFAKVHQGMGGALPPEFGDLHSFNSFEDWWRHPDFGFELFCEPSFGPLVALVSGDEVPKPGTAIVRIRLNADRELLVRDFETILKRINAHAEYVSQARFQPTLPQQQLKIRKLEEALQAFLCSEEMLQRRAIRRLYKRGKGETPFFHRVEQLKEEQTGLRADNGSPIKNRVVQRRLKLDLARSGQYELWKIRKMRLLSRQRKVVKDIFRNVEAGRFP